MVVVGGEEITNVCLCGTFGGGCTHSCSCLGFAFLALLGEFCALDCALCLTSKVDAIGRVDSYELCVRELGAPHSHWIELGV